MKHSFKVYLLHFLSPLHIGNARSDYGSSLQTLSSDGLYAALTACLAKFGKTVPIDGNLGCLISSLFPYWQETAKDKPLFFMPKPLNMTITDNIESADIKRFKKIQWLDLHTFSSLLQGQFNPTKQEISDSIQGTFFSTRKLDDSKFITSSVMQRVVVNSRGEKRDTEPTPFYMDRVSFKAHSGLYFIAEGNTSLLEEALNLLAMEGIGTDRNVGNGVFEWTQTSIELDLPDKAEYMISLSSFIPQSQEQLQDMTNTQSAYEIERRGGWITDDGKPIRKNVIYLFSAGSVLHKECNGVSILGKIVDLNPNLGTISHPVYRCGQAICLPIKLL